MEEDDAPSAIPSAVAWMQRPRVVERARCGGGGSGVVDRSEREYMFAVELRELDGTESVGSVSRRYISMNPRISDSPIQT